MTTADVAVSGGRFEARPKAIGNARSRTDPPTGARNPRAPNLDRQTHPETGSSCRSVSGGAQTSCTENPMNGQNARLVPIDY
jgi:hypothetical protein